MSDNHNRCTRLREKLKRSFKKSSDTPWLLTNCIVLHASYLVLAYWSFRAQSTESDAAYNNIVQVLLETFFIGQAVAFLAIFFLKKRKSVATYGTLLNHISQHKLVAAIAFIMIISRIPYGLIFGDAKGGSRWGLFLQSSVGLVAVLIAQYYVHTQLSRPLWWAIFCFIYNVICFIVIGALVMDVDSNPSDKPNWDTWYRRYKRKCDVNSNFDPKTLPPTKGHFCS
ncbi:uncharacterized protein LOC142338071 [Convolutriloba macropyga]|uniref:uncharacterized protein LOC142338071 n=1 Tax=Convolutriloba macropyga TaxID=536237 RepID=UPI003F51B794